MLTKKVDMSVFVRTLVLKCELQPSLLPVQLLVWLPLHRPEQMQVQVLVQVPKPLLVLVPVRRVVPLLLSDMVLLVELVPVSEQVLVSMPDPPVDQPDLLTWSVPNPQLDQTELLPLSVLEQLSVLDLCKTAAIVSGLL